MLKTRDPLGILSRWCRRGSKARAGEGKGEGEREGREREGASKPHLKEQNPLGTLGENTRVSVT